jgi:hypothetical protein
MSSLRSTIVLAAALVGVVGISPARASLIGDTVTATGFNLFPGSATIGAGVEFAGVSSYISFDFAADTLTLLPVGDLIGFESFGFYVFGAFDDTILNVSIATNTGFSGSVVQNFSYDAHSITLDMSSTQIAEGAQLVFHIQTAPAGVPDTASSAMLLGFALGSCVHARSRTARRAFAVIN